MPRPKKKTSCGALLKNVHSRLEIAIIQVPSLRGVRAAFAATHIALRSGEDFSMDIFAVSSGQKPSTKAVGGHTWIMEKGTQTVTITRYQKTSDDDHVSFTIVLRDGTAKPVLYKHKMVMEDQDKNRGNKSSFGYVLIMMPKEMQGTGIGYVYHWAAAQTAALLGADYFSVDSATTEAMRATCKQSGMRDEYNSESYEGAPGSVVTAALNSAVRKGWKTIMS